MATPHWPNTAVPTSKCRVEKFIFFIVENQYIIDLLFFFTERGVRDVGFMDEGKFKVIPEKIPELIVPDLTDCKVNFIMITKLNFIPFFVLSVKAVRILPNSRNYSI